MQAQPTHAAAPGGENAEGVETSREALQKGARFNSGVGCLGNQRPYAAAGCLGSL
jgi:hypothetical protein